MRLRNARPTAELRRAGAAVLHRVPVAQRAVSPRTVACYRDAFMLFLDFAERSWASRPRPCGCTDITPELILAFLDHLEHERHNAVRSSQPAADGAAGVPEVRRPARCHGAARRRAALAVPMKRFERPMLGFLTRDEMLAVLGAAGQHWTSQRDHLLLALLYNTGARVSEIIGVRVADVVLDGAACVHLHGKGRKQRSVPLWQFDRRGRSGLVAVATRSSQPDSPLLPNRDGQAMTRATSRSGWPLPVPPARTTQPHWPSADLAAHVRHTTAMHLLQSGVAVRIALWLGHESPTTTHRYVEADLAMKERALATPTRARPRRSASLPSGRLAHAVLEDAVIMRRARAPANL